MGIFTHAIRLPCEQREWRVLIKICCGGRAFTANARKISAEENALYSKKPIHNRLLRLYASGLFIYWKADMH